ncbi:MAG: translocation/assembly module TamB domain-containing protein [Pseudomonadota bacterium]
MKRQKLVFIVLSTLFALTVVLVIAWRPALNRTLRRIFISEASRRLNAQVSLSEFRVSLLPPRIVIEGLEVKREKGPLLYIGVRRASITAGTAPIFTGKLLLSRVEIDEPSLRIDLSFPEEEPSKPKQRKFQFPSLTGKLPMQVDEVDVRGANLNVRLPGEDVRLSVSSGNASFHGGAGREAWTWNGGGSLKHGDKTLALDAVEIRASRSGSTVDLEKFVLRTAGVTATVEGKAYPAADLRYRVDGDLTAIAQALRGLDLWRSEREVVGNLRSGGRLTGPWNDFRFSGDLSVEHFRIDRRPLPSASFSFRATPRYVEYVRGTISMERGGEVRVSLGAMKPRQPTSYEVAADKLVLEDLFRMISPERDPPLTGTVSGTAGGSFTTNPLDLKGNYVFRTPRLSVRVAQNVRTYLPLEFRSVETAGRISYRKEGGFALEAGEVKSEGIRGVYRFGFQGKGEAEAEWNANVSDVGGAFEKTYPISGDGTVTGGMKARQGVVRVELVLRLANLGYGLHGPLPLKGSIVFKRHVVSLEGFELGAEDRGPYLAMSGVFPSGSDTPLNLEADLKTFDIGWVAAVISRRFPVTAPVAGAGNADIRLAGPGDRLHGSMRLASKTLSFRRFPLTDVDVLCDVEEGQFIFQKGKVSGEGSSASLNGVVGPTGFRGFSVRSVKVPLSVLGVPNLLLPLAANVDGLFTLNGVTHDPDVDASAVGFVPKEGEGFEKTAEGRAQGKLSDLAWSLDVKSGTLKGEGRLGLAPSGAFDGKGVIAGFALTPWIREGTQSSVNGEWKVSGRWGNWKSWNGRLAVSTASLSRGDWNVALSSPVEIGLREGKLHTEGAGLKGTATDLTLKGDLGLDGEVRAELNGRLSLALLALLHAGVTRADGNAQVAALVTGKLPGPRMTGTFSLSGGLLQFRNFPQTVDNISLKGSLDQQRLFIDELNANLGEGSLKGRGTLTLGGSLEATTVLIEGDSRRLRLRYPAWISSVVSGPWSLSGPVAHPRLRVDFLVHEAVYRDNWDWQSKILTFGRHPKIARATRPEEEHLLLDLRFRSEGNSLAVRNNLATAAMHGDLRVVGSDQNMGLLGKIELAEGTVTFLDNVFNVANGYVSFESERSIRTIFDVTAKTRVKDVEISLNIRTQREEVVAFLSSQPQKEETDLVALLTLGVDVQQLYSGGPNQSISTVVAPAVLTAPLQGRLESGLKRAHLIDTFQFVPYFSDVSKTTGLKMVVGKDLFPRVRALYSTDILDFTADNNIKLEQQINRHISLQQGVDDSPDNVHTRFDVGFDVEFKFDF